MDLTEKVLSFQQGCWTWSNLWESIVYELDDYLDKKKLTHDERTAFLQRFESRAFSMAERFSYFGKTFRALLFTTVRFQLKNFYNDRSRMQRMERLSVELAAYEASLSPLEPSRRCHATIAESTSTHRTVSDLDGGEKRVLIVALKNCHALDDEIAAKVARKLGLSVEWLLNSRDELRELSLERNRRVEALRRKTNIRQSWVNYLENDASEIRELKTQNREMTERIDKMNPYPHHFQIAEILGIPKGTIDSSLHYIRVGRKPRLVKTDPNRTSSGL